MLILRPTKTGVRFEFVDDDSETTVVLDKTDDDEAMVRKLKKVLALVEPAATHEQVWAGKDLTPTGYVDGAPAAQKGLEMPPSVNAGGWHRPPETPERWQGKVEMIDQEGS